MRTLPVALVVALAASLAVAPVGAGTAAGSVGAASLSQESSTTPASTYAASATAAGDVAHAPGDRPDPSSDRLGWEAGYWHNESVDVTPSDGLNETELDAVAARAAARVEVVRELEFEELPPVSVIGRSAYRESVEADRNGSTANRLHQNVKLEALFFVGEDTDALEVMHRDQAVSTLGYYDPDAAEIVVVSGDEETPQLDEITLAQELFHALQDQRFDAFDAAWYPGDTREEHNAADGVIEGDGNFVDYLYEGRCGAEWDCLAPGSSGGGVAPPNYGYAILQYAPYSDGPPFVQGIYESGGWAAVNALYDEPTASTEQYIHPERYPGDVPRTLEIEDRSSEAWSIPDVPGGVDHAGFGEAGAFTMLWYPSYLSSATEIVPVDISGDGPLDAYDYAHPAAAGWDGDRLLPYVTDDSAETNETGYVWRLAWDTPADAVEFRDAYEDLLVYNGGERVGERTWRVTDELSHAGTHSFADAFHVSVSGDTVTVVNAPSVDELGEIRSDVDPQPTSDGTGNGPPDASTTAPQDGPTTAPYGGPGETVGTGTATDDAASGAGGSLPGFGVGIAVAALTALLGAARVREAVLR